jgi:uncharacterized protein YcfL
MRKLILIVVVVAVLASAGCRRSTEAPKNDRPPPMVYDEN